MKAIAGIVVALHLLVNLFAGLVYLVAVVEGFRSSVGWGLAWLFLFGPAVAAIIRFVGYAVLGIITYPFMRRDGAL